METRINVTNLPLYIAPLEQMPRARSTDYISPNIDDKGRKDSFTTTLHHVSHTQKVNRMKDRLLQIEPLRADICRNINLSCSSGLIENLIETSVNGCRRIDRALTLSEICIPSDKTRGELNA